MKSFVFSYRARRTARALLVAAAALFFSGLAGRAQPSSLSDSTAIWLKQVADAYYARDYARCFDRLALLKSASLSTENDSLQAAIDDWEGCAYAELGYFPKAETLLRRSVAGFEGLGKLRAAANALMDLEYMIFLRDGSTGREDSPYLLRAIEYCEKLRDTAGLVRGYDDLAYDIAERGDVPKALALARRAEAMINWDNPQVPFSYLLVNMADYQIRLGQYTTAEELLWKSIRLGERFPDKQTSPESAKQEAMLMLGRLCRLSGRLTEATRYLTIAFEYAKKSGEAGLAGRAARELITEAKARNDVAEAMRWQQEYVDFLDNLQRTELGGRLANTQLLWDISLREREFHEMEKNLERQQLTSRFGGALVVLLMLLFGTVVGLYYEKRKFSAKLKSEVLRQTEALRRSNEELERFAYIASHDLRTPLRNVISFVGLIERRLRGHAPDPDLLEYIQFAKNYAHTMNQIITDVLAFSKIGREKAPVLTPVDMDGVARKVVRALGEHIRERHASVDIQPAMPQAIADEVQMAQLLQNLTENGLKYNENPQPRVEIGFDAERAEPAFFVRDNGIGIEPQYAQKVFEMFARLHTMDKYPGTGLGLAICKKIVAQNNGHIWLESEAGRGTTVFFSLPLAKTPAAATEQPAAELSKMVA